VLCDANLQHEEVKMQDLILTDFETVPLFHPMLLDSKWANVQGVLSGFEQAERSHTRILAKMGKIFFALRVNSTDYCFRKKITAQKVIFERKSRVIRVCGQCNISGEYKRAIAGEYVGKKQKFTIKPQGSSLFLTNRELVNADSEHLTADMEELAEDGRLFVAYIVSVVEYYGQKSVEATEILIDDSYNVHASGGVKNIVLKFYRYKKEIDG
jgi:hypothetical protein